MMKKKYVILIFALSALLACKNELKQATLLESNSRFNLETVNFQEDITKLFAKHLLDEDGVSYDSVDVAIFNSNKHQYKISNVLIDAMELKVPQKEFGFLYKSKSLDSVARFQDIYFERVYVLTDIKKKPVAYYAETEFKSAKVRKAMMDKLIEKYCKPKYSFFLSREFNQCSYEWVLADRTIQIETSYGFSTGGLDGSGIYYKLDFLLVDNKIKSALHQAHVHEFPEKILYEGKLRSYKEFQFEKKSVFKDEFLLNSTKEELIKNENNEYDISLAEVDN